MSRVLAAAAMVGAAASTMTAVGLVSPAPAYAEGGDATGVAADVIDSGTRITVPGAGPLYEPNFYTNIPGLGASYFAGENQLLGISQPDLESLSILQAYDLLNREIGENWFSDTSPQVVDYPASMGILSSSLAAPAVDEAVAMGQQALNEQITNAVDNGNRTPVDVAALSEGTLVVDRELADLADDPNAPPASDLHVTMFSNPELGLFDTYMQPGTTIPIVDYTNEDMPDTQYNVDVVYAQYDFFGDPPDRPWDLLADVNSLFGLHYGHTPAALASLSDTVEVSSVTDSLGGTIDTYMIPFPVLPMLLPLEQIGVPTQIVDDLNSVLTPIVDAGYSSLTPDAGPYFSHGELIGLPTATDIVGSLQADFSPPAVELDIAGFTSDLGHSLSSI